MDQTIEYSLRHGMRALGLMLDPIRDEEVGAINVWAGSAAFWACAVDEQLRNLDPTYEGRRAAAPDGQPLPGIRLARNAITHGSTWSMRSQGLQYPITYPMNFGPTIWRPLGELLSAWTPMRSTHLPDQMSAYEQHVARRPLAEPLLEAESWLSAECSRALDPKKDT